jgi:hypothetical protein
MRNYSVEFSFFCGIGGNFFVSINSFSALRRVFTGLHFCNISVEFLKKVRIIEPTNQPTNQPQFQPNFLTKQPQ